MRNPFRAENSSSLFTKPAAGHKPAALLYELGMEKVYAEWVRGMCAQFGRQEALRLAVRYHVRSPRWFLAVCGDLLPHRAMP